MGRRYLRAGRGLRTLTVGRGMGLAMMPLSLAMVRGLPILALLLAAGMLLAGVLGLVGLFQARKADKRYGRAFGLTIGFYVATIVGRTLSAGAVETIRNGVYNDHRLEGKLLSAAGFCLLLWAVFLACRATSQLLRERGEETWAKVGTLCWILRFLATGIGLIQGNVPVGGEALRWIADLAGWGDSISYLVFCWQGSRLLLAGSAREAKGE